MRDDLRIQCGSREHQQATSLASLAIVLYPIGVPMLYFLLLRSAQAAITMDRPTHLSSALSFLHRDFEARMYCWEIAEQFKKLFLVGIMVWVANDTIVQLGVAMVFTMIFMLFSSIAEPYRKQESATPDPNANPNPNPLALTLTLTLSLTRALPQAGERLLRSHVQLLAHRGLPLLHHAQGQDGRRDPRGGRAVRAALF